MAMIALTVSKKHESTISVDLMAGNCGFSIHIQTYLEPVGDVKSPYESAWVCIHGETNALRDLVAKMAAALPAPEPTEIITPMDLEAAWNSAKVDA